MDLKLIHCNEYDNRFVVFNKSTNKLYKIQHKKEIFNDHNFEKLLNKYKNRFHFWQFESNTNIINEVLSFIHSKYKIPIQEYTILTSEHSGIDCEILLQNVSTCDCPQNNKSLNFSIDKYHILNVLRHLIESIEILSKHNIVHNDIRLANILFNLTKEEINTGIITRSLPILIDFGMAQFYKLETSEKANIKQLIFLFTTCKYGICDIPPDTKNWIINSTNNSKNLENLEKQLTAFQTLDTTNQSLDFHTLISMTNSYSYFEYSYSF